MANTHVFVVLFACCLKILVVCSTNVTITDPKEPNGYNNMAYVLVGEGENRTFTCTSLYPNTEIRWYLANVEKEATVIHNKDSLTSKLSFDVTMSLDNNELRCVTTDNGHNVSTSVLISVIVCPDAVTIECPDSIENGTVHTFSCQSTEGNPIPKLSWSLDGVNNLQRKTTTYRSQHSTKFNGWLTTIKYSSSMSVDLNGKVLSCQARRQNMDLICININATCVINVHYQPIIQTIGIVKAKEGDKLSIECRVDANPVANVTLAKNASLAVEIDRTFSISSVSRLDAGHYICRAMNDIGKSTKTVDVYIMYVPTVTLPSVNITNATDNSNITLICEVEAYPLPTIIWYNPNKTMIKNTSRITIVNKPTSDSFRPRIRSNILITEVDAAVDNGMFRCEATNSIGTENVNFVVNVEGPIKPSERGKVAAAVCIVFFAIIVIFIIAIFVVKRRRRNQHSAIQFKIGKGWSGLRNNMSNRVIKELEERNNVPKAFDKNNASSPNSVSGKGLSEQRDNMPNRVIKEVEERNNVSKALDKHNASRHNSVSDTVNKQKEPHVSGISTDTPYANVTANFAFPRTNLNIMKELGQGAFGKVLYAKITENILINGETEAAVKTLKEGARDSDKEDLIQEIELMKILKPHPNVVRLLGCCIEADPIYMIVEYMGKGNIKAFLRKSRSKNKNAIYDNLYGNSTCLTLIQLIRFAKQVATGMEYLSLQKCIHRDLAARNVLLNDDLICKVSDFGLARDVMNVRVYQRKSEEFRLPIRWMALESVVEDIFTTESDIWSFGILLWEIITLGARPYPGTDTSDVVIGLKIGMRMPRPKHCPPEVYKIMQACWMADTKDRPSFKRICEMLQDLLESELMHVAMERPEESLYKVTGKALANEKL